MSQRQRRIFVYRPPAPEPEPEPDDEGRWTDDEQTRDLTVWLFSPAGAALVWMLALAVILPSAAVSLLILPEEYGLLAIGFGFWVVLGLAVMHWWIPAGDQSRKHSEGLAVAGWHVLITAGTSGFFAWVMLFPDGRRPVFTLGDVYPVVVVGGILLAMFGVILTLLRGYLPGRGLRYAWTLLCMLAVWITLWLVAAHGELWI